MIRLDNNDRTPGCLILFLTLLVLYAFRLAFVHSGPARPVARGHLFVQIAGDLRFPGVYAFNHRPELRELIARAGGLKAGSIPPEAFSDFPLSTGMKIGVYRMGEHLKIYQNEMSAFYKNTLAIPISLNRESEVGLTAVPGIGAGLAKAIVRERSKRGGFKRMDEILSIRGLGHGLFEKIRPHLNL